MTEIPISELVEKVRSGDHDAFAELVERHRGMVFGICYRLVGNSRDAEYLAHEAFVETFVKLGTLRDDERFSGWLRTLTLNQCRMWYRRQQREVLEFHEELPAAPEESSPSDAGRKEVFTGISKLSLTHRLTVVLHYLEDLSYAEIATFLDVPIGTVMSRLHRARNELKRHIETLRNDEDLPMVDQKQFQRDVDAEIALLLEAFQSEPEAMERLSVILTKSPARVRELIRRPADEATLGNLATLLPRLGGDAMQMTLDSAFSGDPQVGSNAMYVLRGMLADCRSECGGIAQLRGVGLGDVPSFDVYVLLDRFVACQRDAGRATDILIGLMEASEDLPTQALLGELALCFGKKAIAQLTEAFWQTPTPEDVYRRLNGVTQTLRNTGTLFLRELGAALETKDSRSFELALAGIDLLSQGICEHHERDGSPSVPGPRFIGESSSPDFVRLVQIDVNEIDRTSGRVARFLESSNSTLRNAAVRILARLQAREYIDSIRACLTHEDASTRVRAIQALAAFGDQECAPSLLAAAREGTPAERRAAVAALGRLGAPTATDLLVELTEDPDSMVRKAAVIALGELEDERAEPILRGLLQTRDKIVRKAASSALFGAGPRPAKSQGRGKRDPRYGRKPAFEPEAAIRVHYISADAALRALPELRSYDDREITERIASVCGDWATTRRKLIEHRLMRRPSGHYEFTELGEAVWRVEHYIMTHYLRG